MRPPRLRVARKGTGHGAAASAARGRDAASRLTHEARYSRRIWVYDTRALALRALRCLTLPYTLVRFGQVRTQARKLPGHPPHTTQRSPFCPTAGRCSQSAFVWQRKQASSTPQKL